MNANNHSTPLMVDFMIKYLLLHCKLCVWVRVWPWARWKQLLVVRALRHPQCLSLWAKRNVSPSPFFLSRFDSVSFCLFYYLCLPLPFSFFLLCGLNYSRMSPSIEARWTPCFFSFLFIGNQNSSPYFNSNHTFPICANKPWKYQH